MSCRWGGVVGRDALQVEMSCRLGGLVGGEVL